MSESELVTEGYCQSCKIVHSLPAEKAKEHCLDLMERLRSEKRIDFDVPLDQADPHFSTDALYGKHRGQMFGTLLCEDHLGNEVVLKAYSSQHDGVWNCDGWSPPLADDDKYMRVARQSLKDVEDVSRKIDRATRNTKEWNALRIERKNVSRKAMSDLFDLYTLSNFRGETKSLKDVWTLSKGIPSGTGDCCAPKLLVDAVNRGLKPISLAEFYWGEENFSGSRKEGEFYGSCENKCAPILGFILCGVDTL